VVTGTERGESVDLLIVGSGVGAVVAALIARDRGLMPLIVEKSDKVGGTSALSGGVLWIPANPLMARDGVADSRERARQYLDAAVWHRGPAASAPRRDAFLRAGPEAVSYLESKGMKFLRPKFWPDYHSDLPGAEQTSRSIMAELFDLNALGEWKQHFAAIERAPLRFHVDEAFGMSLIKRTWRARFLAARFALRVALHKLAGRDVRGAGAALQGRLLRIALDNDIPIWRNTAVESFLTDGGKVTGVLACHEGKAIRILSRRGVLLNSGGFARNPQMREHYGRKPVYSQFSAAPETDTGEMIRAAMSLGAAVDCMDEGLWGLSSLSAQGEFPGGRLPAGSGSPVGHHFDISLPHCIVVDQHGERFVNEAASYMEVGQKLYERHTKTGKGIPAWAIIESRHRDRYPWGMTLGRTPKAWLESGYMKKAASIDELARACGIDESGLRRTLERFNRFCDTGIDDDYKRGGKAFDNCHGDPGVKPNPNLGAIEKPPFYAVAIYPGDVSTWGGLVCDEHARVLDTSGQPIEGLYATGTATASVCGRTYPGAGASLGPAMVFGYIAARHVVG